MAPALRTVPLARRGRRLCQNSRRSPHSRPLVVTGALTQVFDRLGGAKFETVLIDEAAQASELANLQAVAFGCKRCAVKPSSCWEPRMLLQCVFV